MPIDNDLYNRMAGQWWDESCELHVLRTMLNPCRFGYFREILTKRLGRDPSRIRALDIGCGGGFLAEEFAKLGCDVVGVDPSAGTLETARAHAENQSLNIDYRSGTGEEIPADDGEFDLVYCCDVLEHVTDLSRVMRETARVMKPGGLYFFDTINRTLASRIFMIGILQQFPLTSMVPPDTHDWKMFITPEELEGHLTSAGLSHRESVGMVPAGNPLAMFTTVALVKLGRITPGEAGRRLKMKPGRDLSMSYMGWAEKSA